MLGGPYVSPPLAQTLGVTLGLPSPEAVELSNRIAQGADQLISRFGKIGEPWHQ